MYTYIEVNVNYKKIKINASRGWGRFPSGYLPTQSILNYNL